MNIAELIENIAKKEFDVDDFVGLAIKDVSARDEIVHQMLTNPHIMVYYHCYYVVSKASQTHPKLFYRYWDRIAGLIDHKNSYHRDFAIIIIANLAKVDQEDRFSGIEDAYFALINDEKIMTGNCCVQNLLKIYRSKPGLREKIITLLLDIDDLCDYTAKQLALLKYDVLDIFDQVYEDAREKDTIKEFIRAQINSISPKTRKKAKELVRKYSL